MDENEWQERAFRAEDALLKIESMVLDVDAPRLPSLSDALPCIVAELVHELKVCKVAITSARSNLAVDLVLQGELCDAADDYCCDHCGWRSSKKSRPLGRGTKVGCPVCCESARFDDLRAQAIQQARLRAKLKGTNDSKSC